jgi:hypothetical protein
VTIWESSDGVSWQSIVPASMTNSRVTSIFEAATGYVATGYDSIVTDNQSGPGQPSVWTSPDATTWTPVVSDGPDKVYVGSLGLFGTQTGQAIPGSGPSCMKSSDGQKWIAQPDCGPLGRDGHGSMRGSFSAHGNRIVTWGAAATGHFQVWVSFGDDHWRNLVLTDSTPGHVLGMQVVPNGVLAWDGTAIYFGQALS